MTGQEPGASISDGGADNGMAASSSGRQLSSTALFRGQREIVILHRGQEYRLRITKSNKLILTK